MSKVGRNSYVRTEPTVHIVGDQHRINQRNHTKWKREQAKLDDYWVQKRKLWGDKLLPPENMVVRSGGLVLSIPHEPARWLVHKRLAGVVGYYENRAVDAIIESHDLSQFLDAFGFLAEYGLDEPTVEPSMVTVKLIESVNSNLVSGTVIRLPRGEMAEQLIRYGIAVESSELATVNVTAEDLS